MRATDQTEEPLCPPCMDHYGFWDLSLQPVWDKHPNIGEWLGGSECGPVRVLGVDGCISCVP